MASADKGARRGHRSAQASLRQTICSGWKTSSNLSAVRKPSATHASLREMFSLKAFLAVLAALS